MTPQDAQAPTVAQLAARILELHITEAAAGCTAGELIRRAQATADPLGYLETFTAEVQPDAHALDQGPLSVVEIEAPMGFVPMEQVRQQKYYLNRKVEARLLTQPQQIAMRRLQRGLDETGARLTNGQRVASNADAVRWLLERMHEQSNGEEAVGSG